MKLYKITLILALTIVITTIIACTTKGSTPTEEPTPTRVPADDLLSESLFYNYVKANYNISGVPNRYTDELIAFSEDFISSEIRAPLAIVMRHFQNNTWEFAKTDIIDTVQDLNSAGSVLFVEITETNNDLSYNVYFTDKELTWIYNARTDDDSTISYYTYKVSKDSRFSLERADEQFFNHLADNLNITESSVDLSGVLYFIQNIEVNSPEIIDAVSNYAYPENERLSNNPHALLQYSCYVYRNMKNVPENNDSKNYLRDPSIFFNMSGSFLLGSVYSVDWEKVMCGESYLIVIYERTGVSNLGYSYGLYSYTHRATVVDALTKQVIAWEEGSYEFATPPPTISSDFFGKDEYDRDIYVAGNHPPRGMISVFLGTN